MRSNDLMILQAYLLYLVRTTVHAFSALGRGRNIDPRSLSCLIGIAVRIATHLSIHRDGSQTGLSTFDTEQTR
ncbi:hypothetical protein NUU61_002441 [Penicillium alfredii]|uniref:Secreted protein n=1 Tax=Penicillium alfredii TaxID=1506179 RepID=A0A9W9FRQ2_9EURO|nr:uncharacterized protein NUU61_002441 [Penicillium alfredii]KAJ5105094.1 hypothetical protein NUU61_002441 [Penicillium alfredii]